MEQQDGNLTQIVAKLSMGRGHTRSETLNRMHHTFHMAKEPKKGETESRRVRFLPVIAMFYLGTGAINSSRLWVISKNVAL
jgi:hypothetical protein